MLRRNQFPSTLTVDFSAEALETQFVVAVGADLTAMAELRGVLLAHPARVALKVSKAADP